MRNIRSDWLIGDNVLRSIYSIYDFGDFDSSGNMGNPYVKLHSLVDPNKASAEFHQVRGGSAATNITYNAANTTVGQTSTGGGSGTSVTLSDDMVHTINQLGTYIPVILAIMALNALTVVLLILGALVYVYRRRVASRSGSVRARKNPGRAGVTQGPMSTMPLTQTPSFASLPTSQAGADAEVHGKYQPVSMAVSEDAFVPPSPAFQRDSSPLRPMSVA